MQKSSLIRITAVAIIVALFVLIGNEEISSLDISSAINAAKGKLLAVGVVGFSMGLWAEEEEKSEKSDNGLDLMIKIPSAIILTLSIPVGMMGALGFLGSFD